MEDEKKEEENSGGIKLTKSQFCKSFTSKWKGPKMRNRQRVRVVITDR